MDAGVTRGRTWSIAAYSEMGMPAAAAAAAIAADDEAAVEAEVDGPAELPALGSAACVVIM